MPRKIKALIEELEAAGFAAAAVRVATGTLYIEKL
jgi:hypothetical protein